LTFSEKSRQLYKIKLIAEQYLSTHASIIAAVNENMDLIWLIQPLREQQSGEREWERMLTFVKGHLELIQAGCRESAGEIVSFVLDDSPVEWANVADRFATLNMMMNYRIGQGSGMLLLDKLVIEKQSGNHRDKVRQSKLNLLAEQLDNGHRAEFHNSLQECALPLQHISSMHDVPAQEFYYSIGLIYLSYMNRWHLVETVAAEIGLHKLMQPGEHDSWKTAFDYLGHVGEMLFNLQNQEEERRANAVITLIQKHVQEHLHNPDELSLVRLAELVYFNPSYLSRLFKQVTGENLSEYISSARMMKARKLLEKPELKIQEVAEMVGYGTATNFTRSFRKALSMTPQEYRSSFMLK
jgi:two-component system response regulator YesN